MYPFLLGWKITEETVELPVILDAMALTWRHGNVIKYFTLFSINGNSIWQNGMKIMDK